MKIIKVHVDSMPATMVLGYADGERYTAAFDGHDNDDGVHWAEGLGMEEWDEVYTHLHAYAYVIELDNGVMGDAFETLDEAGKYVHEHAGYEASLAQIRQVSGIEAVEYVNSFAPNEPLETNLTDMLANMMHAGIPFSVLEDALRIAHDHYTAEVKGL